MEQVDLTVEINGSYVSVDIDRSTQFALNYTAADLTNPTISSATYSDQITIPKTPNNNDIFGQIWDVRSRFSKFNPNARANFRLHVNNNIFQVGYIKMESIEKDNYKIRLYGNLGNFFGYISNIKVSDLDINYTHAINIDELVGDENRGYALTYQGEYENFDNNLKDTGSDIKDVTWKSISGQEYTNVDLNENQRNETGFWGEYRSYYQKPVLKLRPILEKIKEKAEEEGYNLDIETDDFFDDSNPYYNNTWLLSNAPGNVEDINGGVGFIISEFGDPNDLALKIKNEAAEEGFKNLVNGQAIKDSSFISTSATSLIDVAVPISSGISPDENGGTVEVNLTMKIIATCYDDPEYKKDRLRSKKTAVKTGIILYKKTSDTSYSPVNNSLTYPFSQPSVESESRRLGDSNVEVKRPTNDFFGKQNFSYDKKNTSDIVADNGTVWKYKASVPVESGNEYVVGFYCNGNTWWEPNGSGTTRKYGIAFRIEGGSVLLKNNPVQRDDDTDTGDGRTDSQRNFRDLISGEITCAQLLLSYTKLFGLMYNVNPATGNIEVKQRTNYYKDELIDWTYRVDRSREFTIEPTQLQFRKGVFKYNPLGTKYENAYRDASAKRNNDGGREYGSYQINTGYELGDEEYNYLDGTIFDNCIIASDTNKYYSGRGNGYKDNKQLPHLEDASGSAVEINGVVLLFRGADQTFKRPIALTDDTSMMDSYGTKCWNSSTERIRKKDSFPGYYRTAEFNGEVYSLNFADVASYYSDSEELMSGKRAGIIQRYWRSYLEDKLKDQSKVLTCYVVLRPTEVKGDLLSKFVYLDQSLWVIQSIKSFNPLSEEPTKVTLVKVLDKNNYLSYTNFTDEFKVYYNDNKIYDNSESKNPDTINITEGVTEIALSIDSTVRWDATSGLRINPTFASENTVTPVIITIPASTTVGSVSFKYGATNSVTVNFRRTIYANVTATTTNGTAAYINGQLSQLQVAVGSSATFTSTGTSQFMHWIINGVQYNSQSPAITITGDTTANAVYLEPGTVLLYCYDTYTTITGIEKTGDYWQLKSGQSYTFNNSESNFSGFLFSSDSVYTGTGAREITEDDTYLQVYYDTALINATVTNYSPEHVFTGDSIKVDEGISLDFEVEPDTTENVTLRANPGATITIERGDYHYPLISTMSFPSGTIYNITIDGYRVGWDGNLTVTDEPGFETVTHRVYSPVSYVLNSNLAIDPRSGSSDQDIEIELTGSGGRVVQTVDDKFDYTLTINQEVVGTADIGWENESVNTSGTTASNIFNCPATYTWIISSSLSGVTINPSAGNGTKTVNFTLPSNNTGSSRTIVITAVAAGMSYSFNLVQAVSLSIVPTPEPNYMTCPGTFTINVTANTPWIVTCPADKRTNRISGTGTKWYEILGLNAVPNYEYTYYAWYPSGSWQNAQFQIAVDGYDGEGKLIYDRSILADIAGSFVFQAVDNYINFNELNYALFNNNYWLKCPILEINPETTTINNAEQTYALDINCNCNWAIEVPTQYAGYVHVTPLSGYGEASVEVTIKANTTGADRTANIDVKTEYSSGNISEEHSIKQNG